jgi:hypothetical protein
MLRSMRRSLADARPEIASEWDRALNGDVTPHDVTFTSSKCAHWLCSKGHRWVAQVRSRTLDMTTMWRWALYLCRVNKSICVMDPPPRREPWAKPVEPVDAR